MSYSHPSNPYPAMPPPSNPYPVMPPLHHAPNLSTSYHTSFLSLSYQPPPLNLYPVMPSNLYPVMPLPFQPLSCHARTPAIFVPSILILSFSPPTPYAVMPPPHPILILSYPESCFYPLQAPFLIPSLALPSNPVMPQPPLLIILLCSVPSRIYS